MQTEGLNVYKICSLEVFYWEAIIPLVSIILKSSFYETAQVSDSHPWVSSFSHGFVKASWLKLRYNYKTFSEFRKILWYFYFTVQKNWGKMSSFWGNEYQWQIQAVTTSVFLISLEVPMELIFKKVHLLRIPKLGPGTVCHWIPGADIYILRSLGLWGSVDWGFCLCFCLHDFNPGNLENVLCSGDTSLEVEICKDLK